MTLVWSLGVSALVPLAANAEGACPTLGAGDLVKLQGNSAVFLLNSNLERLYFPNAEVFKTWYSDYSGVNNLTQTCFNAYPQTSSAPYGIGFRPGSVMVKEEVNNTVYVITPNGTKNAIPSEAVATALYGSNWATKVRDINSAWWTTVYPTVGAALTSAMPSEGMLVKKAGSASVYFVMDGKYYMVSGTLGAAAGSVQTVSDSVFATVEDSGSTVTSATVLDVLANIGQSAGTPVGVGNLTVSLSASTPVSKNIPVNSNVEFLRLNLRAGAQAINVNGLKLTAAGLGAYADINDVTIYSDNMRYGNSRDIGSNKDATINFTSALVVPANSTREVVVKASVAGTGTYALSVASAADVMSTAATVGGSFAVVGNAMTGVNTTIATLTMDDEGSLASVKLGDTDALVAKFKATNGNVEDTTFKQVILKRDSTGTASDSAVENLKLMVDGSQVAAASKVTDKFVTFTLTSPITILKNAVKRFEVLATIVDGAGKTFGLTFDSKADVTATGNFYNFPAVIDISAVSSQLTTINAGAVSIEKVNATNNKVKPDVTDAQFGSFKVTVNSGKTVELSTLKLTAVSTNDNVGSQIENVEVLLKNTNTVYDLTSSTGNGVYRNTSMGLVLSSGTTYEFVVRADVKSSATNGDYVFKINDATTDLVMKETENDTAVTDITPNSVSLNKVTVESSSLTFSKGALSASYSAVVGSTGHQVMLLNVTAGQASDVKLTQLSFANLPAASTMDKTVISEFKLKKGTTLLKTVSANELSSEQITFSSLNEVIPANTTVTYSVEVTFVNDVNNDGDTTQWYLSGYGAEDTYKGTAIYDSVAEDVSANGVIVSGETGYTSLLSARTITIVGTGSLDVAVDNTVTATKYDTYALAGASDVAVATFKLKASNENILVTSLGVVTSANVSANVSELSLWDGATKVAWATNIGSVTTTFDQDFVVSGEKFYTLKATLTKIGQNEPGALNKDTTFRLAAVVAEGASSGTTLTADNGNSTVASGTYAFEADTATVQSAVSKSFGVLTTRISSADLKSSASGVNLSTSLSSGIAANAAIVELQIPSSSNTNSDGSAPKFTLATTTFAVERSSNLTYAATIERIGGSTGTTAANATSTTAVSFALSGVDYAFNPGETVYLLVKVTPVFTATIAGDTSLRLNLNTASGLYWTDRADASVKTALRLPGVTTVNGTTIHN